MKSINDALVWVISILPIFDWFFAFAWLAIALFARGRGRGNLFLWAVTAFSFVLAISTTLIDYGALAVILNWDTQSQDVLAAVRVGIILPSLAQLVGFGVLFKRTGQPL